MCEVFCALLFGYHFGELYAPHLGAEVLENSMVLVLNKHLYVVSTCGSCERNQSLCVQKM